MRVIGAHIFGGDSGQTLTVAFRTGTRGDADAATLALCVVLLVCSSPKPSLHIYFAAQGTPPSEPWSPYRRSERYLVDQPAKRRTATPLRVIAGSRRRLTQERARGSTQAGEL